MCNWKIDFSFVSAHYASFMKIWPLLRNKYFLRLVLFIYGDILVNLLRNLSIKSTITQNMEKKNLHPFQRIAHFSCRYGHFWGAGGGEEICLHIFNFHKIGAKKCTSTFFTILYWRVRGSALYSLVLVRGGGLRPPPPPSGAPSTDPGSFGIETQVKWFSGIS